MKKKNQIEVSRSKALKKLISQEDLQTLTFDLCQNFFRTLSELPDKCIVSLVMFLLSWGFRTYILNLALCYFHPSNKVTHALLLFRVFIRSLWLVIKCPAGLVLGTARPTRGQRRVSCCGVILNKCQLERERERGNTAKQCS